MRNIKVWGGTHGNEPLGMAVADSLMQDPIEGVDAGIVNLRARELGQRVVHINMNDGYPGDETSTVYETSRAPAVLRESQGYFAVLDFHDYNVCLGADNAFVASQGVSPEVLGFLAKLGFKSIIQASYNSLREHVDNGFSVDIGLVEGGPRTTVDYWRQALKSFAQDESVPTATVSDFDWYQATGNIHTDQVGPHLLDGTEAPFVRLPASIESKLGFEGPQHWSCWNPSEKDGWWAETCTPIPVPDPVNWPGFREGR